jgi:Oxidoreductase molybdopterin binding domain
MVNLPEDGKPEEPAESPVPSVPQDSEPVNPEPVKEDTANEEPRIEASSRVSPSVAEASTGTNPDKVDPAPASVPVEEIAGEGPSEPDSESEEIEAEAIAAANAAVLAKSRSHTRRSFLVAATAAAAGYGVYRWIDDGLPAEMQPEAFRKAFQTNAAVSKALFAERGLAPTYPLSRAENIRVNGVYGLKMALKPESYRLQVVGVRDAEQHPSYHGDVTAWEYEYEEKATSEDQGHDTKTPPPSAGTALKMAPESMVHQEMEREQDARRKRRGMEEAGHSLSTLPTGTPGLLLTMQDILKLPRYEMVTQFKCIEGWSQIVHWAGVRMVDFLEEYPPATVDGREPRFVYMETPDGDYYTGYDMDACRHPQTLLVTEMMGAPLTQYHGEPLRLYMTTKYGYKQIKRIGLIAYTNQKPDDYWTKLGYDWYAGL